MKQPGTILCFDKTYCAYLADGYLDKIFLSTPCHFEDIKLDNSTRHANGQSCYLSLRLFINEQISFWEGYTLPRALGTPGPNSGTRVAL